MDLESRLKELEIKAGADPALCRALLATKESPNPLGDFCALARNAGVSIDMMDLVYAGEESYAAMRRSTNGGGENSPLLAGEDDYYELFLARLAAVIGRTEKDSEGEAAAEMPAGPESGADTETEGGVRFLSLKEEELFKDTRTGRLFENCVGVFDSGVGGLTVLAEMTRLLPKEDFLYFGDSANAPYGNKEEAWVRDRSFAIAEAMFARGVKAVVIACNTATAAAVADLREAYPDRIIIGVEPALNVAVRAHQGSRFLVMATGTTLALEKYHALAGRLKEAADFIPLPCDGLAARIEQGDIDADDLRGMLQGFLEPYIGEVDGIVLGCTHYPLIKQQIREFFGDIPFYDGGEGTARELRRRLTEAGLCREDGEGSVYLASSLCDPGQKPLYEEFYRTAGMLCGR